MKLTELEIVEACDRLNRAGRTWQFALAELPGRVLRVDRAARTWKVVMTEGETFTNLDDAGWLFTGIGAIHDGINRERNYGWGRGRQASSPTPQR